MNLKRDQHAFGMIEVLVALLIIAIGLLGTITLHVRASQAELESYQRIQALILLEDMASRLTTNRMNRDSYDLSLYNITFLGAGSNVAAIGGANRAETDLLEWDGLLRGSTVTMDGNSIGAMIGARGCIDTIAVTPRMSTYRISVAWQGMHPTFAPIDAEGDDIECAGGLYGDEAMRRAVSRVVVIPSLD